MHTYMHTARRGPKVLAHQPAGLGLLHQQPTVARHSSQLVYSTCLQHISWLDSFQTRQAPKSCLTAHPASGITMHEPRMQARNSVPCSGAARSAGLPHCRDGLARSPARTARCWTSQSPCPQMRSMAPAHVQGHDSSASVFSHQSTSGRDLAIGVFIADIPHVRVEGSGVHRSR